MTLWRFILSVLLILGLSGCENVGSSHSGISESNPASSALEQSDEKMEDLRNTVDAAMKALKNLDMETFNACTNNKQLMVTPWGDETIEYTLFGELSENRRADSEEDLACQLDKEIVRNLSWEISDLKQKEDTAKIKLKITNLNMKGLFQKAETDSGMIAEIRKIPQNCTKTAVINLKAEKQDKKWILLIDFEFANAISADIWSVDTEDYSNETLSHKSADDRAESGCAIPESLTDSLSDSLADSLADTLTKKLEKEPYTYEGVAKASWIQRIEFTSASDHAITAQITDLHDITDFLNQEERADWTTVEGIPDTAAPVLSIVRYSLERKTINPQLKEQSRDFLYQDKDFYYIEDKTIYNFSDVPGCELPRYYEIPDHVGEYLKQFLEHAPSE